MQNDQRREINQRQDHTPEGPPELFKAQHRRQILLKFFHAAY